MLQLLDKKKSFNADASLAFLTLASIGQPNQKGSYPLGKSRIVYKALKKFKTQKYELNNNKNVWNKKMPNDAENFINGYHFWSPPTFFQLLKTFLNAIFKKCS